uniref:FecR family protein n=1 Tax=uncultured Draconibacterium sp. TaxID=1573823 RepID=UPI0032163219
MKNKKEKLQRFFSNKYSRKDQQDVCGMFQQPEEYDLKQMLKAHWNQFSESQMSDVELTNTSERIHRRIRFEEGVQTGNRFIRNFQRIAAILIIPLIVSFLAYFLFQQYLGKENLAYAEIQCPLGVRTKFYLPDGTTGFLNSGSTLKYPVSFSKDRQVNLKGEAYFDVVHDTKRPFTVETKNLKIGVLGTQFNVVAFDDDEAEEVILQRGKVEVSTNKGQLLTVLKPNEKLLLNRRAQKFLVNEVEALQFTSWTEGKLILRNEKFSEVVKRLGRWYNAEIRVEDEELLNYAFRATFTDESLEEVLKLMKLTAPFTFKEQERTATTDNEYERKIVLINLDKKRQEAFN